MPAVRINHTAATTGADLMNLVEKNSIGNLVGLFWEN